jgi:hypothetical protein
MNEEESSFVRDCAPPWVAFPELVPTELPRYLKQGASEAWFDDHWRPFWTRLTRTQKDQYLDFWRATPPWRDALAAFFEPDEDFDMEADARESEEHLRQWRANRNKGK